MARRICCPNIFCRSTNIVPVSTKTKFSVGRAVVGGTVGSLFNPLGTIIGAASGINGKRGKLNFYVRIAEKFLSEKYKMGAVITWRYWQEHLKKNCVQK